MHTRLLPLLGLLVFCLPVLAQEGTRYGVALDAKTYPQGTAKETLASVMKAAENKKHDYLLAQLVDPKVIDARVKASGGNFAQVVEEAREKLDAAALKQFAKFEKDGTWTEVSKDQVQVTLKESKDRSLFFKKVGDRWFVENKYNDPPPPPDKPDR